MNFINNNNYNYPMVSWYSMVNKLQLNNVDEERNLGVFFDLTLKFSKNAAKCAAKGNRLYPLIKRTFSEIVFTYTYKT